MNLKFCVSTGFLRDCILAFTGLSDEDCQVYICFNSVFCVAICGGHFALSGHHLGRPAAILLELDFLSLCLETRALALLSGTLI